MFVAKENHTPDAAVVAVTCRRRSGDLWWLNFHANAVSRPVGGSRPIAHRIESPQYPWNVAAPARPTPSTTHGGATTRTMETDAAMSRTRLVYSLALIVLPLFAITRPRSQTCASSSAGG